MNPFEKRATEYIRDDQAFLPYVTPEPLITYFEAHAKEDVLFDRLALMVGSPGSGKTTLGRLFTLPTLTSVLRNTTTYKALFDGLRICKAVSPEGQPSIAGCRIPLESDYRECWELPYEDSLREKLLYSLLQARTVLAWLRALESAGHALSTVKVIPRLDAAANLEAIGGTDPEQIREAARQVERDVYKVTAGLIPPALDKLPEGATRAYDPFDVIEFFELQIAGKPVRARPLVICDDAHVLHPKQLDALITWLSRREIRVARWVLMRIDALTPQAALKPSEAFPQNSESGRNRSRDMVVIRMQAKPGDRGANRRAFRKIARDMSERYLRQMPVFMRRGLHSLPNLLDSQPPSLPVGKLKQLEATLSSGRRKLVGAERRRDIERQVDDYLIRQRGEEQIDDGPDVRAMMVRIVMERYLNRVPQSSLFDEPTETVPSTPLKVDSSVRNAARMHLHQEFELPYFYGFDLLCDAATENAERFLRLAGHLVAQIETQLIREADTVLTPVMQERLLKQRAERMLSEEDLPDRARVVQLCETIAKQCLAKTLEANAPLGEGPNAWGIRESEFDSIPKDFPDLARVLKSGLAYNMFTLVRDHGTKGEQWCLIELSGTWAVARGLTLRRGGFLERRTSDLADAIRLPESSS